MPIDPTQLQAFAAPPDTMEDLEPPEGEEATAEPEQNQEQRLAHLVMVLGRYSEDLQDWIDEVDQDALDDPEAELSPDDIELLKEAADSMDTAVRDALDAVAPITMEDARFIADELEGLGATEDADRCAGWLYRMSQVVSDSVPSEEEDMEEEDGGEGEPGAEEEME